MFTNSTEDDTTTAYLTTVLLPVSTNSTENSVEFWIPISLFHIGSLLLTVIVVVIVAFIVLCHTIYRRRQKKSLPVRMISNNDFNVRISDVLDVDRSWRTPCPRKSRNTAYFRQESYEATRYDRTYAVPYVNPAIPTSDENDTQLQQQLELRKSQEEIIPNNVTVSARAQLVNINVEEKENNTSGTQATSCVDEETNIASGNIKGDNKFMTSPILPRGNDYQIPKTPQLRRTFGHYQVPGNHYQTPKSPIMSIPNYHIPRRVTQV